MLIVSDQGPGVAQEERALIFERFKRGRETGGEAGFGLGLAIGRELAQRMGGSLVLTDTDGPGATFTLRLQPTEAPSSDRDRQRGRRLTAVRPTDAFFRITHAERRADARNGRDLQRLERAGLPAPRDHRARVDGRALAG